MERFFTFSNLSSFPEIIHGISNRSYGNLKFGKTNLEETIKNRQHFLSDLGIEIDEIVSAGIFHGNKVVKVGEGDKGRGARDLKSAIAYADGLATSVRGVFLFVTVADCLPILMYEPTAKMVILLHAGWRGIIKGIIFRTIEVIKSLGGEPQNLFIGIGPGICQRHFVVRRDVLEKFFKDYPQATFVRNHDGYVDLKKAVSSDLKKVGILGHNLEISKICPVCENGVYGSFRKEKEKTPFAGAVIGIKND